MVVGGEETGERVSEEEEGGPSHVHDWRRGQGFESAGCPLT